MPTVIGYETRMGERIAAELVARSFEAAVLASRRVEAAVKQAASPYVDSGATVASVHVEPYGGLGAGGPRAVGMIASVDSPAAQFLDGGTGGGGLGTIERVNGGPMPVGKRSPQRPNGLARGFSGITFVRSASGQKATKFFTAPNGVPLGEMMRNVYAGIYRRTRV